MWQSIVCKSRQNSLNYNHQSSENNKLTENTSSSFSLSCITLANKFIIQQSISMQQKGKSSDECTYNKLTNHYSGE